MLDIWNGEEHMDDVYEITLLMDFYGQLLTERQFQIIDMHYNNDLSLGEIADNLNISRQGVHDSIKKGKIQLNKLEQELGLVSRFTKHTKKLEGIYDIIREIKREGLTNEQNEKLDVVESSVKELIKDL